MRYIQLHNIQGGLFFRASCRSMTKNFVTFYFEEFAHTVTFLCFLRRNRGNPARRLPGQVHTGGELQLR